MTRDVDAPAPKRPRDIRGMQRAGAAARHQRECARIMTALDAHLLDRVLQALLEQLDDARGRLDRVDAERRRDVGRDRVARARVVEGNRAVGETPGAEAAQHQVCVGDGRVRAAEPVAGWPRPGARPVRTDLQQAAAIDTRDGPAAAADGVNVDRRQREMIVVQGYLIDHRDLAPVHERDVAARASDLHQDQIVGLVPSWRPRAARSRPRPGRTGPA